MLALNSPSYLLSSGLQTRARLKHCWYIHIYPRFKALTSSCSRKRGHLPLQVLSVSLQVSLVFKRGLECTPAVSTISFLIDVCHSLSSFFLSFMLKDFLRCCCDTFLGSSWRVSRITWCLGFLHTTLTQISGLRPLFYLTCPFEEILPVC